MARFFKHVGEHNSKKVIIVQRELPGEEHLAAVIYTQLIPTRYHDDIMRELESPAGQESKEFMDVMNRRLLSNGQNMLVTMVNEGWVKKAQAKQIIVKPNANSAIRLDELTKLLKEAGQGTEAIRRLEELDRQQGRYDPIKQNAPMPANAIAPTGVLDDAALATSYLSQAAKMRSDAQALLTEASRLENDAQALAPPPVTKVVEAKSEKKRGRPAKSVA